MRPAVPACLAVATLVLAPCAPALAADDAPAAGEARSALSLLSATVGSTELTAGVVEMLTTTADGASDASVAVTPLQVGDTPYGRQVVGAGSSRTVEPVTSGSAAPALAGLVEVAGPALEVGAEVVEGTARTTAGASSLGSASLLGLPLQASGGLVSGTTTGPASSGATRTLELSGVALPSVADLLGKLGLDLSKLPIEVLRELVAELGLVTPAVTAAGQALDAAAAQVDAQVDAAQAEVDRQAAALAAAQRELAARTAAVPPLTAAAEQRAAAAAAAQQALTAANARLAEAQAALTAAGPLSPLLASLTAAVQEATAGVAAATTQLAEAQRLSDAAAAAVTAAQAAVAAAQAAVDTVQRLLAEARAALAAVLAGLQPQLDALLAALTAVLDDTPLVALDGLTLATESTVLGAGEGEQVARVVGGEVRGLRVLGTDVLSDVLGSSTLELTPTVDDVLGQVAVAVDELTGTLSDVLSTVPGLPTLEVPAPQVDLLVRDATTGVDGLFGTAGTAVTGLQVTLPAITLPAEVALPDALALPGLAQLPALALPLGTAALAPGDVLTSTATTLGFGTFTEDVRFRSAAAGSELPVEVPVPVGGEDPTAPGTDEPDLVAVPVSLPRTGASDALAVLGLGLVAGAAWLRRRGLA